MPDQENIVSMPFRGSKKRQTRQTQQTQQTSRAARTSKPKSKSKSKSSSSPSSASSASSSASSPRVASLLHYRPKSDLVHELSTSLDRYTGEEWISVRRFPGHVATAVDQVRKKVDGRTPGFNPTVACAIHLGLCEIEEHRSILALRDVKDELDRIEGVDTDVLDSMYGWFRYFPISTSDSRMARVARRNVSMPAEIKRDLGEIGEETGVPKADLLILCLEVVLMMQPEVDRGYRVRFEESVGRFFKLARVRRGLGRSLVKVTQEWTDELSDDGD